MFPMATSQLMTNSRYKFGGFPWSLISSLVREALPLTSSAEWLLDLKLPAQADWWLQARSKQDIKKNWSWITDLHNPAWNQTFHPLLNKCYHKTWLWKVRTKKGNINCFDQIFISVQLGNFLGMTDLLEKTPGPHPGPESYN